MTIELYGIVGWTAAALLIVLYLLASNGKLPAVGTLAYFILGITAFCMVVLRFAEAF